MHQLLLLKLLLIAMYLVAHISPSSLHMLGASYVIRLPFQVTSKVMNYLFNLEENISVTFSRNDSSRVAMLREIKS